MLVLVEFCDIHSSCFSIDITKECFEYCRVPFIEEAVMVEKVQTLQSATEVMLLVWL